MNRKQSYTSFLAFLGKFTQTIYTLILPEITSGFRTTIYIARKAAPFFVI